jgi:hypothetical protein
LLPSCNKAGDELWFDEDYADLLDELTHFGVIMPRDLRALIEKYLEEILAADKKEVAGLEGQPDYYIRSLGTTPKRAEKGVLYTHVGITRLAMRLEFGSTKFSEYQRSKS